MKMNKFSRILIITLIAGGLAAGEFFIFPFTAYQAYTNKFAILNSAGTEIFRIGDDGNLTNYGQYIQDDSTLLPRDTKHVNWQEGFEIRNSSNQIVFYVEAGGVVHLNGTIHERANNGNDLVFPGGNNNFIIENSAGNVGAYITNNGDIYLKGSLVFN